ncbi:hypothetical protein LTR09_005450 [Extremus antarcticus]|uniref:Uncharacterized protein n=1 Tax=Extremus antarcticus TaxID=702011 RepID=A0AAJ0DGL6_9PEZI|nr:hypothetical protein LTR09_005450 [Extremus antarcticus]
MAMLRSLIWLGCLAQRVISAPVENQQALLSPSAIEVLDSEEYILRVTTTFDAVDLKDGQIEPLESYGYLDFDGYKIFEPKSAAAKGLLNKTDVDCAVAGSNALLLMPNEHDAPFIFKANETALAGLNVSNYFDFISVGIKPLSLNGSSSWVTGTLNAWSLKDGVAENVQEIYLGFYGEDGHFDPWELQPNAYIANWGEKVNLIEFKGEDEDGNSVPFCIDNIVLEYHRSHDDE